MYRSIEDFLKDWKAESEFTARIFLLITDEKQTEKIHEHVRSLERLSWHLTQTITEMGCRAGLFESDLLEHQPIPNNMKTIADTYTHYSDLIYTAVRKKWTDSSLTEKVAMYGEDWEKGKVLRVLLAHQTHHRGQMTVVMRILGLSVIGFYGPAKEEWAEMGIPAAD